MSLSEEMAVESETQNAAKTAESMARGYQKEFLVKAKEKNIIVCLETGCGKTLVAVLLLKELSFFYPTATPNIAIFLVPTVMLVEQQANVIRELSELKVGQYDGQHNGGKDHLIKWKEDVYDLQVLVMTPQILLNVLRHALVKMESIRVLIFDECHHCQKGHPYAQIMKEYYFEIEENYRPKILGMTASPIIRKGKSELQINHDIDALEHLLDSKVVMVDERKELDALIPKPNIRIIEYDRVYESHDKLKSLFLKCTKDCTIKEDILQSVDDMEQSRKKKRDFILKLHNELEYCIHELGLWFGRHVVEDASLKLTVSSHDGETWDAIQDIDIQTHLKSIAKSFDEIYAKEDFNNLKIDNLKPDIVSNKVICLVNLLRETRFPDERCILFVQRTVAAKALKSFLSHIFTSICCDYVTGRMKNSSKKKAVNEFRIGLTNLLIATNVAEEGLDLKDCNLVVQFDMPNTLRSYVQSRGRARLQGSNYVILKDRFNVSEENELDTLIQSELIVKEKVSKGPPPAMNSSKFREEFNSEIFRVPQTGATLSIGSSVGLLFRYCSTLPKYQSCVPRPKFTYSEELDGIICSIDLPPNAAICRVVGKPSESKDVAKKSACFRACIMLHSQGELSDYLLPYSKKRTHEFTNSSKHQKNLGRGAILQETVVPAVWAVPLNMESSSTFNLHAYKISFSGDRDYVSVALLLQFPLPETVANLSLNLELRYRRSVTCKLEPLREVILDHQQIALAEAFQKILFAIVLDHDLVGPNIPQNSSRDEGWYLLLPMRSCQEENGIDWNKVNKLSSYVHAEHSVAPEDSCFAGERLPFLNGEVAIEQVHGLLVKTEWGKDLYCITGVLQDLNAASPFPNRKYENYIDYFSINYKYDIKHTGKPLLKARFLKTAQNFLQRRHIWKDGKGTVKTSSSQAKSCVELPSEICNILCSGLSESLIDVACILPSFMERFQSLLVATQMRDYFSSQFPEGSLVSVEKVLEALTTEKCMEGFSLERLELLGDSYLKFAVSCNLFIRHDAAHEGFLSEQRKKMVCNALLFKLGSDHGLPRYIRDQLFDPEYWLSPCHPSKFRCDETKLQELHGETWESKENTTFVFCSKGHRWMKMKIVSDVVEALIGAYLEDAGEAAALAFMKFIGIDANTESDKKLIVQNKNKENVECERRIDIIAIEEFLSYRFKEKRLLIEAFTHASFNNDHSRCYQRLEFLGDSVLDFMITRYLYKKDYASDAGMLTDMRSSIVSNESFARITVKHRLDKHLMHSSPELSKCMDEFIEYLRASESVEIGDWDGNRCPKVLGDIFESLAGAVFVDVGFDVDRTWKIFLPILEPLISSGKLLLHPVRELQELCQSYGFACSQESCGEAQTTKFTFQVDVPSDSAADGNSRVTATVTWKDKLSAKRQAAAAALCKLKELGFIRGSRRKKANARRDPPRPTSSLHLDLTRRQLISESSSSSELSECKSDLVYETETGASGRDEEAVQVWEQGGRETSEVEDDDSMEATGSPIACVGEGSGREGWGTEDAGKKGGEEEESGGRGVGGGMGEGKGGEGWEEWDCWDAGGGGLARARLNLICTKRRWKSPSFRCDKEEGPPHDKWFTVVVELLLPGVGLVECHGDPRRTLKAAKDSAAYELLQWLAQQGHLPPPPHHHQHASS